MPSKVTELGDLLDDLPDALVGVDRTGAIRIANRHAESLFGYERESLVGVPFENLVPGSRGQIQTAHEKGVSKTQSTSPPRSQKLTGVQRDGTRFPLDVAWSTLDTGGDALAVAAVRDMSRYEQAETKRRLVRDESEEKRAFEAAQSMIEWSQDSVVAISPEGKITEANAATVKLTGVPREKLIGTSFSEYFTDPVKAEAVYQLVLKEEGSVTDYPLTLRHVDGHETQSEVRYNASVYRDASGKVQGVFASARDVTEHMKAERAMVEQQEAARDRLEELERFQRLTVGRELRMIQLKKEIEHLKRFSEVDGSHHIDQGHDDQH
jgi:PAS domain S-box-containing protein